MVDIQHYDNAFLYTKQQHQTSQSPKQHTRTPTSGIEDVPSIYTEDGLRENVKILREDMNWLKGAVHSIMQKLDEEDAPDNTDMSIDDVKSIILKECKRGEEYYPGEFALKHSLDYNTVVEALTSLQKEGRVEY